MSLILNRIVSYELILNHEDSTAGLFSDSIVNTGSENANDPNANTYRSVSMVALLSAFMVTFIIVLYSIIGQLDAENVRNADGAFYFKMQYSYPDGTHDVLYWSQTSWLTETEAATGFVALDMPSTLPGLTDGWHSFHGLARSVHSSGGGHTSKYLDGVGGNSAWNSVGAYVHDGISAEAFPAYNAKAATGVSLYVATYGDAGVTDGLPAISITACDGWTAESTTNSMTVMLRGVSQNTPFFQGLSLVVKKSV